MGLFYKLVVAHMIAFRQRAVYVFCESFVCSFILCLFNTEDPSSLLLCSSFVIHVKQFKIHMLFHYKWSQPLERFICPSEEYREREENSIQHDKMKTNYTIESERKRTDKKYTYTTFSFPHVVTIFAVGFKRPPAPNQNDTSTEKTVMKWGALNGVYKYICQSILHVCFLVVNGKTKNDEQQQQQMNEKKNEEVARSIKHASSENKWRSLFGVSQLHTERKRLRKSRKKILVVQT